MTSLPGSSSRSRRSGRRRACWWSSPNGPVAGHSSPRSCWPPGASSRRSPSRHRSRTSSLPGSRRARLRHAGRCDCSHRPADRSSRADLAAIAEEFEAELTGGPPRSSNAPHRGDGPLDADLARGLEEGIEYGFIRDDDDGLALRHELVGQAIEADLLPSMRIRHHAAVARALVERPFVAMHHFSASLDPVAVRQAAIAAADSAGAVDAPLDELRALELAIAAGSATGVTSRRGGRRRSDPPVLPPNELNARAAEAAFAAGRPVRAARIPRRCDRGDGRPPGSRPARVAPRPARPVPHGSPATPRDRSPPVVARSTSCRRRRRRRGQPLSRVWPRC